MYPSPPPVCKTRKHLWGYAFLSRDSAYRVTGFNKYSTNYAYRVSQLVWFAIRSPFRTNNIP